VKARPGWGSISAVKNSRIYVIDPDIVSRPGPRLVDALETLAQALYPERFE
jgi:iron complex transport system substrate-binding protein